MHGDLVTAGRFARAVDGFCILGCDFGGQEGGGEKGEQGEGGDVHFEWVWWRNGGLED